MDGYVLSLTAFKSVAFFFASGINIKMQGTDIYGLQFAFELKRIILSSLSLQSDPTARGRCSRSIQMPGHILSYRKVPA